MSQLVDKVKDKVGGGNKLKQGSKLPDVGLLKEENPTQGSVDLAALKGKNIIVAVPGAFSSACSTQVPGYIEDAEKFAGKGVQGIYVVAVNDAFVMQAWKKDLGGSKSPAVHFIADDDGKFTKGAGMDFDATGFFGERRSNRYAAVIEDGVVKQVFEEASPVDVKVSKSDAVLQALE